MTQFHHCVNPNRQQNIRVKAEPYPRTVAESMREDYKYRRGVRAAVKAFAKSKPFRGTDQERFEKLVKLHNRLCEIYGVAPSLTFNDSSEYPSPGVFIPSSNEIVLSTFSVITYLHEFGHALGKGEKQTCRWSLNLFRDYFPRSWSRLVPRGHMMVKPERVTREMLFGLSENQPNAFIYQSAGRFRRRPLSENEQMSQTMSENERNAE